VAQELRERAKLFQQLIENIHEVFWLASADQRQVFYVSRSYEDIWGRSCESLLRNPMGWVEAIHPEDRPLIEAEVARDRGEKFTREYRIVRPDGGIRWILARGYPVCDKTGHPYRIAGLAEDVTERKQLEHAWRESEQALSNLSRRIMQVEDIERRRIAKELHDTAAQDLVAVIMNLESLRDGVVPQNATEAKQLEDSIAMVENATHEIRTLAYILHPPRLDKTGLVVAIRDYADGFGKRTGIAIGLDLPDNSQRPTEAVEIALFRVVQECLANVHRHAQSKAVFIRLEYKASGIEMMVRDEGCGIPPQILGESPGRGTGLGVGIPGMREDLHSIGGNLEIESNPGGTIVRSVVPCPLKIAGSNK